jgi:hypothetical protein
LVALKVLILKTFIVIMKKTEITFDMGLIIYISSTNEEKIHERNPLKIFRSFILFYNWAEKY